MTTRELVDRVKVLKTNEAQSQVEKYVLELLGPDKRGQLMVTLYKRRIRRKLKELSE